MASQPRNAEAIRRLLHKSDLPVTSTYQAAGVIDQASFHRFAGRVGLFNNQAGDRLLRNADLVITIGYSPVEYEPVQWSKRQRRTGSHRRDARRNRQRLSARRRTGG